MPVPPLTLLYASASRPDIVSKALASDAHVVIVDLEDSVESAAKDAARDAAAALLAEPPPTPVYVRINALATEWWRADVEALAAAPVAGLVVPKVEAVSQLDEVAARAPEGVPLFCLIESALGVERAFELARHPRVGGLWLGEADLRAETGAEDAGLDWARSRVVFAAAAAGLPRPPQSVYVDVGDLAGLRASCERGRALGHLGRSAVHPSQLPTIVDAYRPTGAEVETARDVLGALDGADATGTSALVLDGRFVDTSALRAARSTLELAAAYGTS